MILVMRNCAISMNVNTRPNHCARTFVKIVKLAMNAYAIQALKSVTSKRIYVKTLMSVLIVHAVNCVQIHLAVIIVHVSMVMH